MILPFCREFGWDPVVLTVDQKFVEPPQDPLLLQTIPKDVPIHRVGALNQRLTRKVGLGNLGLRALPWIVREGGRLIREERIDLVYFSTAMFAVVAAGSIWRRRFGVPFVIDFQDPWLNTYYRDYPHIPRPRKYWFAHTIDKVLEPRAVKKAAGITAVSPGYISDLRRRYGTIDEANSITLPFGASTADRELAKNLEFQNEFFQPNDGLIHGVYAGVIASAMRPTVELIMEALARGVARFPDVFSKVRLHFVGTSYAMPHDATPSVLPIAEKYGVTPFVDETVPRVPYFHALRLVEDADFLIVPGSEDPQYTASKIYPYILARKP
ncbi:MAG TPA: glycosyltransferase, partial [Chthoniobacterales bacterium]